MTKGENTRLVSWRWRLLYRAPDDNNVARTSRHFGISRKSFYKWKRRLDEHGQAGLGDRARIAHALPRATPPARRRQDPVPPAAVPFWRGAHPSVSRALSSDRHRDLLRASDPDATRD